MVIEVPSPIPAGRNNSMCTDEEATSMIREGLTDAFRREQSRNKVIDQIPTQRQEDKISEEFPFVGEGDELVSSLSEMDFMALRIEAHYIEKRRMKDMMKKVQEQMSEYHELLEYSRTMEARFDSMQARAKALEQECNEKTIKMAELEREVIDLKLHLATEKTSTGRILNELAHVKSENQVLIRTHSVQSLQHEPACDTTHMNMRKVSTNLSLKMPRNRAGQASCQVELNRCEMFGLVRPPVKHPRVTASPTIAESQEQIAAISPSNDDNMSNSGSVGEFMNRTVSWMNNRGWGSRASLAVEQDVVYHHKTPTASSIVTPTCGTHKMLCGTKSFATATTAGTASTRSIRITDYSSTSMFSMRNYPSNEMKNEEW